VKHTGFGLVVLLGLFYAPAGHLDGVGDVFAAGNIVLGFLHRAAPFVERVLNGLRNDLLQVRDDNMLPFSYTYGLVIC
jgi:hypothetical protein